MVVATDTRVIFKPAALVTGTSCSCMPTKDTTNAFVSAGTLMVNLPFTSVFVMNLESLVFTLAPGSVAPFSSETIPVIVLLFCAYKRTQQRVNTRNTPNGSKTYLLIWQLYISTNIMLINTDLVILY